MRKSPMILLALILMISGSVMGQTPHPDAFLTYPIPEYSDLVLREGYLYIDGCGNHFGVDYDIMPDIPNSNTTNTFHIVAAADGTVSFVSDYHAQYGYYVVIDHDINSHTYQTLYAHMNTKSFLVNDINVKRGQFIGWGGTTGTSTGVHLHFELKDGSVKKDPYQINYTANGYICNTNPAEYTGIHYPELQGSNGSAWTMNNNHYWQTAIDGFPAYSDLIVPGFYEAGVDGWRLPSDAVPGHSEVFLNAYNYWINHSDNPGHYSLGIPRDNGGGIYVHDVYGMLIQDFYNEDNGLTHPHTALIYHYDPDMSTEAHLLKGGFWDEYMNNAGWMQYGYPISNEYEWVNPDDDLIYKRQNFSTLNGVDRYFLWREGSDVIVKKASDNTLFNLFNAIFQIAGGSKALGDDGIYYGDHFVASFDAPIHLLEGETFSGLYALIGGVQTPINQFTVTGDMTIVVGGEEVPDPCEVGYINMSGDCFRIDISENYAYLANKYGGLKIIDISDPTDPVVKSTVETTPIGVSVSGNYAYMVDYNEGIKIIDISDPTNPIIVGSVDTDRPNGIYVSGNYAYVTYGNEGVKIIDVSDPTNPIIVGSVDTDGPWEIYISGDYAYVADSDSGIKIIDISDPTNPIIVGSVDTYKAYDIYVSGDYAYVADHGAGIKIIDVSDPTNPIIVGSVDTDLAIGIYTSGNYAYVADSDSGIKIIDISDPTDPIIVNYIAMYGASEIFMSENYITTWANGLHILQKNCGTTAAVSANFVGDPVNGVVPFDVNFSDYSTGYPTTWAWDFGDGNTSDVQNPIHTYSMHGTFDVSLTVGNGASTDVKTISEMIVATKPPIPEDPIYPHCSPNPFNPITVISYKLDKAQSVKLEIFDLRGHRIDTLVDKVMSKGVHRARFDGRSHASGVYFYKLSDSSGTQTHKMMLLK